MAIKNRASLPRPALTAQAQVGRVGLHAQCAEAQSKDFGIIATEKGYNLYVCGNGGMKPQHAFLLRAISMKST